jgi:DNA-binding IclR family transcriptional regulator
MAWYVTASGKVMAAFCPADVFKRLMERVDRDDKSSERKTDIRSQVTKAKELGYAEAHGELDSDIYGVAVPIFDSTAFAVAAIGCITPEAELSEGTLSPLISSMTSAATRISGYLGHHVPLLSALA